MERKWLGSAIHPRFSWLARHGLQVLAGALAIAGIAALWSLSLRREVHRRTRELADARDVLSSTLDAVPDPLIESLPMERSWRSIHSKATFSSLPPSSS